MRTLALLLLFSSAAAEAQNARLGKTSMFAGTELGYLHLSTSGSETNKNGIEGALKLMFSHNTGSWGVDLGGGYTYSQRTGGPTQVITRAFEAEFTPRYRFGASGTHSWLIGPTLQFLSGGDVSYDEASPYVELNSLLRGGLKVQYEFGNDWTCRAGLSAITDLNIDRRNLAGFLFELQFGLTPKVIEREKIVEKIVIKEPDFAQVEDKSIRIYLGEAVLSFPTGSNSLNSKAKEALAGLVPILLKNVNSWDKIRIEGHTDIRNGKNSNQQLSEARADAVKNELIKLKVPVSRISSKGFGSERPIDPALNEEAYLLNRRVEIWLDEVDSDKIAQIMTELKQLH